MVALLDANVLIALAWPTSVHNRAAQLWFASRRAQGWATCTLTQAAFVRLSAQPAVVEPPARVPEGIRLLERAIGDPHHEFWPLEHGIGEILPEIRERLMGHRQITDALLLDLAIRNKGTLATFDRRLENLLPPGSDHRSALEILPLEFD